jgi:glycosyltransferase involved in cell wall biosynthesis
MALMPGRPRLVFASHYAPLTLTAGAPIRTYRLLTGLSAHFDVTFVTFAIDPYDAHALTHAEVAHRFGGLDVVTVPAPRLTAKRVAQLRGIAGPKSYAWGRWHVPAYQQTLRDVVRRCTPTIVHFNDLGVALSGPVDVPLNVYAAQNIEHRIAEGAARRASGARKVFAAVEAPKIRREEHRVWREMALCLAVSELDAAAMRAGGARRVELCPVGTDPVLARRPPRRDPQDPLRLIFVGSRYHPNEHGLAWFISDVFPRVARVQPTVLEVVGPKPERPLEAQGVTYTGPVPSLDPHYDRAHAAIVPIFYGSGVRGKVVEAMSYGKPVISTGLGVEGLPVQPGVHYVHADDAAAFARALVRLADQLRGPSDEIVAMLAAARLLAERHFWPAVIADLIALYATKVERREGASVTGDT